MCLFRYRVFTEFQAVATFRIAASADDVISAERTNLLWTINDCFAKKKGKKKTIPFGNQSSLIKADQSNRAESNESRGHKKEEKGNRVWTGAGFTNVIERQSRSDGRPMGSLRSRVTRPHPAPRPLIRLVGRLDANVVEWRRPDAPRPQSPFRLHHNTAKKTR